MMAFDTNILIEIDLLNPSVLKKLQGLREKSPSSPVIPFPVVSEYYYGFLGVQEREKALKTLAEYEILNTSKNSAIVFAELKCELQKIQELDKIIFEL